MSPLFCKRTKQQLYRKSKNGFQVILLLIADKPPKLSECYHSDSLNSSYYRFYCSNNGFAVKRKISRKLGFLLRL